MTLDSNLAIALLGIVGSGGIAWGGARAGLGSIRAEVKENTATLKSHEKSDHEIQLETVQRLTRIETKLDRILGDSK